MAWAPSAFRNRETHTWSALPAVGGGLPPHRRSTRRSVETTSFALSSRTARRALSLILAIGIARPSRATSSGPRILKSTRCLRGQATTVSERIKASTSHALPARSRPVTGVVQPALISPHHAGPGDERSPIMTRYLLIAIVAVIAALTVAPIAGARDTPIDDYWRDQA